VLKADDRWEIAERISIINNFQKLVVFPTTRFGAVALLRESKSEQRVSVRVRDSHFIKFMN
jgi:hypothetical protein